MAYVQKSRGELIEELRQKTDLEPEVFEALRDDIFIKFMECVAKGKQIVSIKNGQLVQTPSGSFYVEQTPETTAHEWLMPKGKLKFKPFPHPPG